MELQLTEIKYFVKVTTKYSKQGFKANEKTFAFFALLKSLENINSKHFYVCVWHTYICTCIWHLHTYKYICTYIGYIFKKYKADFKYWEIVFNKIMINIF